MTGKTPAQAESDARAVGFTKFRRIEEPSNETAGVVFAQDPAAGTTVSRATTITYRVAVPKPEPTPTVTESESASASSTATPN